MKYFNILLSAIVLISCVSAAPATYFKERCGPGIGNCDEGSCCSKFGWCGTSEDHCGIGCQSEFGKCNDIGDRMIRCGSYYGSCSSGDCCSEFGWCGTTQDHCGNGCQSEFGRCNEYDSTSPSKLVYEIAGLMGSLYVESLLRPDNLEDKFENILGITDREYTNGVNNGSYKNFVNDQAGYGLAQWTSSTRKQGLLNYAKEQGTGIDDLTMQLNYLWGELTSDFSELVRKLKSVTSVRQACINIIYSDGSESSLSKLDFYTSVGEIFYSKYA
ncbi:carbohydrate-binding module family 18 protein [Piromyces sp. E2]|nr:carbohydrate-binding module family 18 protein [Piromyces sp. E2]|eukprot:OUM62879.1 carbohydrate-binding module family 18 protein [Piromyces sp. E2]